MSSKMDMNTIEQTEEFEEWLHGLSDEKARKAVVREVLKMQGGLFGDVDHIDGKVWEARIHYGPGYRVYYMRTGNTVYLLLCGGTKKRQQADIEKAKELAAGI